MTSISSSPPDSFNCPIMADVMTDPVIAADGFTYERAAIEEHFRRIRGPRSPMTNNMLSSSTLIPNRALKDTIEQWKESQRTQMPASAESSTTTAATKATQRQQSSIGTTTEGKFAVILENRFIKSLVLLFSQHNVIDEKIQTVLVNKFRTTIDFCKKITCPSTANEMTRKCFLYEMAMLYVCNLGLILRFPSSILPLMICFQLFSISRAVVYHFGSDGKSFQSISFHHVVGIIVALFAMERVPSGIFGNNKDVSFVVVPISFLIAWIPDSFIKFCCKQAGPTDNNISVFQTTLVRVMLLYTCLLFTTSSFQFFTYLMNACSFLPMASIYLLSDEHCQLRYVKHWVAIHLSMAMISSYSHVRVGVVLAWIIPDLLQFFSYGKSKELDFRRILYCLALYVQYQHIVPSFFLIMEYLVGGRTLTIILSGFQGYLSSSTTLTPSQLILNAFFLLILAYSNQNSSYYDFVILISKFVSDWFLWVLLIDNRGIANPQRPGNPVIAKEPFINGEEMIVLDHTSSIGRTMSIDNVSATTIRLRDSEEQVMIPTNEAATRLVRPTATW